jgi:hypothetical protein
VAAWVARLSAQMGASRCRKSAILLSGIMSAAVRDQRISRNPCDGVSLPRLPDDLGAGPVRVAVRRVCRAPRTLGRSDSASA